MSGIVFGNAFQAKRGRPVGMTPIMDPVRTGDQEAGVPGRILGMLQSSLRMSCQIIRFVNITIRK